MNNGAHETESNALQREPQRTPPPDPVFLHARREAGQILLAWAIALSWTIGYCSAYGYGAEGPLKQIYGIPAWVFWGVAIPWVVSTVFTCYYSLRCMKDDPLGEEASP